MGTPNTEDKGSVPWDELHGNIVKSCHKGRNRSWDQVSRKLRGGKPKPAGPRRKSFPEATGAEATLKDKEQLAG